MSIKRRLAEMNVEGANDMFAPPKFLDGQLPLSPPPQFTPVNVSTSRLQNARGSQKYLVYFSSDVHAYSHWMVATIVITALVKVYDRLVGCSFEKLSSPLYTQTVHCKRSTVKFIKKKLNENNSRKNFVCCAFGVHLQLGLKIGSEQKRKIVSITRHEPHDMLCLGGLHPLCFFWNSQNTKLLEFFPALLGSCRGPFVHLPCRPIFHPNAHNVYLATIDRTSSLTSNKILLTTAPVQLLLAHLQRLICFNILQTVSIMQNAGLIKCNLPVWDESIA